MKGRNKVEEDIEKVGVNLSSGACRLGYVVVFEECDWGFEETFAANAEAQHHGCRVRICRLGGEEDITRLRHFACRPRTGSTPTAFEIPHSECHAAVTHPAHLRGFGSRNGWSDR